MALANYSDLLTAVDGWLQRGGGFNSQIPDFITLAENEFNRVVRTPDMEMTANITVTSGTGSLPANCVGIKTARVSSVGKLKYLPPDEFDELDQNGSGNPVYYTNFGSNLLIWPSGNATVAVRYYLKISALTATNTTNWLMTRHPDLYLFGTLLQAEFYGWNDDRLPLIRSRVEQILEQINQDAIRNKHAGQPLVPRTPVAQLDSART